MSKKGLAFLLVTYFSISLTGCGKQSVKPVYTVNQAQMEYKGLVNTLVHENTRIGELFSSLNKPEREVLIDSLHLIVNRPFLYVIQDSDTGMILFMERMNEIEE